MTTTQVQPATTPSYSSREAAMQSLDPLVGTWEVSGPDGVVGHVRFEWMGDRTYLLQHVSLRDVQDTTEGVEFIGFDPARGVLASHFFGSGEGQPLEYVWEVSSTHLTIWFGDVGSPARYTGEFSADGNVNSGAWEWPGGGYPSTMRRR